MRPTIGDVAGGPSRVEPMTARVATELRGLIETRQAQNRGRCGRTLPVRADQRRSNRFRFLETFVTNLCQ
jgi:hypothetical protein